MWLCLYCVLYNLWCCFWFNIYKFVVFQSWNCNYFSSKVPKHFRPDTWVPGLPLARCLVFVVMPNLYKMFFLWAWSAILLCLKWKVDYETFWLICISFQNTQLIPICYQSPAWNYILTRFLSSQTPDIT